jgi:hypothetical protein
VDVGLTRLAAIAGIGLSVAAWASPPLEFKGVPFGTDQAALRKKVRGVQCQSRTSCMLLSTTYAGEPASAIGFEYVDGKLASVQVIFEPRSFEAIAEGLQSRYGPPSQLTGSTVGNLFGAKAQQAVAFWALPGGDTIRIERFSSKLTRGSLFMLSAAGGSDMRAQRLLRANKKNGDM